ncbi:MAG: hypothetical protein WBP31_08120 [Chitinophagales bacterium]|nr:hypothetical protein [Bacteroidota bacterium]MBL0279164.1 hypothetical protein [Bacteroidota bacterium]MBP8248844.1 hypothetical protein [Chitinophagales bacterium]
MKNNYPIWNILTLFEANYKLGFAEIIAEMQQIKYFYWLIEPLVIQLNTHKVGPFYEKAVFIYCLLVLFLLSAKFKSTANNNAPCAKSL